jgi:hypothetical protein
MTFSIMTLIKDIIIVFWHHNIHRKDTLHYNNQFMDIQNNGTHNYDDKHNDTKQRYYYYFWHHNIHHKDTLHYNNQFMFIQNNGTHNYDNQHNDTKQRYYYYFWPHNIHSNGTLHNDKTISIW